MKIRSTSAVTVSIDLDTDELFEHESWSGRSATVERLRYTYLPLSPWAENALVFATGIWTLSSDRTSSMATLSIPLRDLPEAIRDEIRREVDDTLTKAFNSRRMF